MAKMKRFAFIISILLLATHLAYSRSIRDDSGWVSGRVENNPSFLEWGLSATTETCQPTYGFLPCSSNIWGILFLVVVYEILLSIGGQYVGTGSNLFFEIIGPGVFGASLFQLLGTVPQTVLVLVSSLSGSTEAAQQRVNSSMGLLAGTTVMLLTLIWGTSVVLGSYDLSVLNPTNLPPTTQTQIKTLRGTGVVTDVETTFTARIVLISLIPFVVLLLAMFFGSTAKKVIILLALIITIVLLLGYMFYQIFQPWVQNRRFEYLMTKYAKDKLLRLFSTNGRPDLQKIHQLFKSLDRNNSASVSAAELRVLLLGVKIDDDDLSKDKDVEDILDSFDTSGDGRINQDEFIRGMTQLISDLSDMNALSPKKSGASNSKNDSQAQQPLLANGRATSAASTQRARNTWLNYLTATFYVIFGTFILCALGGPLITNVVAFAQAANLSSFSVSYLVIPFAMNYGVAMSSLASAGQKNQRSISLTLSALYGGVYMNNIMGLMTFLAPVYARDLSINVSTEVVIVLIICTVVAVFASLRTIYARWMGYIVVLLYPISLAVVYLLTSVVGWS